MIPYYQDESCVIYHSNLFGDGTIDIDLAVAQIMVGDVEPTWWIPGENVSEDIDEADAFALTIISKSGPWWVYR